MASKAQGKRPVSVDDDSDVDDLDDVLDDFAKKPSAKPTPQPAKTSILAMSATPSAPPPSSSTELPDDPAAMEFANEFARQMEDMLRDLATTLESSGSAGGASASDPKSSGETDRLKSPFAEGFVERTTNALSDLVEDKTTPEELGDAFQTRLNAAMARLQLSDTNLQADASEEPNEDLTALLGEDESMQNLLENMMNQLMCKDVLYEPLKELNDKFPSYLASNEGKLSESDLAQYRAQHACASKIVAVFEDPGYKDDDPKVAADIVALMSEMQEYGTPPAEIMGDLPSGPEVGPDGVPQLPEGCIVV